MDKVFSIVNNAMSAANITLTALTPGTAYTVQVHAIGGSASDWSNPVSRMSL